MADFSAVQVALKNGKHVATKSMTTHGKSWFLKIDNRKEYLFQRSINRATGEFEETPTVLYWDDLSNKTWQILS